MHLVLCIEIQTCELFFLFMFFCGCLQKVSFVVPRVCLPFLGVVPAWHWFTFDVACGHWNETDIWRERKTTQSVIKMVIIRAMLCLHLNSTDYERKQFDVYKVFFGMVKPRKLTDSICCLPNSVSVFPSVNRIYRIVGYSIVLEPEKKHIEQ